MKRYENRFYALMKNDPDIVCWFDQYGLITEVNPSIETILGYRAEEVIHGSLDFVPLPYRDGLCAFIQQIIHSREPIITELTLPHKQGHLVHLSIKGIPIFHQDQLQEIFVMARDTTKQKQAELHLKEIHQNLKNILHNQQGMTLKFTKAGDSFVNTLCDGDLLYRLGWIPKQINGMTLCDFLPREMTNKTMIVQKLCEGTETFTYETEHKGITYLTTLRPVKENGKVVQIIASCVDITQRKQYEELVLKTEKLTAVGQLAAGIAHEIRNPLAALQGFVKLLRESGANPRYLDIMAKELDRINTIVDVFVNLAKPQNARFEEKDIRLILEHVITLMNTHAIMNNIELVCKMDQNLPPVLCEENQIKQVFLNLLKNAIEAMPEGGKIVIKARREENTVLIQIIDQGKGMSAEVISRLGEPFYTTKEEGTGLGIMMSRKIIEDHNGSLIIKSKEGKGTTMEIRLPVT
jgi:PAS domain S-box-containing protein